MADWKTLSRETVFSRKPWLVGEEHRVRLPDGTEIADCCWLATPECVHGVAITADGQWLCFRQVKQAVKDTTMAVVGGLLEAGAAPLAAASQRELPEEACYEAATSDPLGSYSVDANRGAGVTHLFLARADPRLAVRRGGRLEEQQLLLLSESEDQAGAALECLQGALVDYRGGAGVDTSGRVSDQSPHRRHRRRPCDSEVNRSLLSPMLLPRSRHILAPVPCHMHRPGSEEPGRLQ